MVEGSGPGTVTRTSDLMPALGKEFLGIDASIEYDFTVKRVCDMIKT